MSIMSALAEMRARQRRKRERDKPLPWYCLLLSGKCIEPETDCKNCHVWLNHKLEVENNDTENHNDKGR